MDHPIACSRGATLDSNAIFRDLRARWLAAKKGRIGTDLCKFLETRKQLVSCYATGSDNRHPPMWVLMRLLADLRLEMRLTDAGVVLTRRRGPGDDGPGTRLDDVVVDWIVDLNRG